MRNKWFCLVMLVVWIGLAPVVFGETDMDPKADKILKAVQAYMTGLDSLLVEAETVEESVYGDTHKLQFGGTLSLGVRRGTHFFAAFHTPTENRRMYVNDGTFTVFDEDVNVYAQTPTKGSIEDTFASLQAEYGMSAPGGELFSGNAYELLVKNASRVIYVGETKINGIACHHVAGMLQNMDWQLWIRKEGDPALCRYVITDREVPMAPQFSITFLEWKGNAKISDKQFQFEAPADAEAIEFVR